MIPAINIKHDLDRITADLDLLAGQQVAAAVRALNRTMVTVRAEAARSMRAEYKLPVGVLKKQMRFTRATRASLRAVLTFSKRRFRLTNWAARQTPRGVVVRMPWAIETGAGKRVPLALLRHAFIQSARGSGVRNVFVRVGAERYPLDVLLAPSLSAAFVERNIGAALSRRALERFAQAFLQEAVFQVRKGR